MNWRFFEMGRVPILALLWLTSSLPASTAFTFTPLLPSSQSPPSPPSTAQPGKLQSGDFIIDGVVAGVLMEDHFDTGKHYMYVEVDSDDGRRLVFSDIPHNELWHEGQSVRWVVRDATPPADSSFPTLRSQPRSGTTNNTRM